MLDHYRTNSLEIILEEYKKQFGEEKLQGFVDGLTLMISEANSLFTIKEEYNEYTASPSNVRTGLKNMLKSKGSVLNKYKLKSDAFTLEY